MRHGLKLAAIIATVTLLSGGSTLAEVPRVVATIKPIHALVAAVMGDLGTPSLIVKGGASPHTYSLRPSDASVLEAADLVFWTGHGMELFLEGALESLAAGATLVELAESPGIELLPVREGGAFEPHAGEEHEGSEDPLHDAFDMHYWLDPVNAGHMVAAIASALAAADPGHAATYRANAAAETARLDALTAEVDAALAPVRDRPFIVFHDAYQYFEARFGLSLVGSVTVTPDTMPGAQRIHELRQRISTSGAACVFAEPQFEPAVVQTILEGTPARAGTLDPEGAGLPEGPGLYDALVLNLAHSLLDCLAAE